MKEIFVVIALGITMSLIPNLLEGKKIDIKLPKILDLMLTWLLILLSMAILYFGYYNFNLILIFIGIIIYIITIIFFI